MKGRLLVGIPEAQCARTKFTRQFLTHEAVSEIGPQCYQFAASNSAKPYMSIYHSNRQRTLIPDLVVSEPFKQDLDD